MWVSMHWRVKPVCAGRKLVMIAALPPSPVGHSTILNQTLTVPPCEPHDSGMVIQACDWFPSSIHCSIAALVWITVFIITLPILLVAHWLRRSFLLNNNTVYGLIISFWRLFIGYLKKSVHKHFYGLKLLPELPAILQIWFYWKASVLAPKVIDSRLIIRLESMTFGAKCVAFHLNHICNMAGNSGNNFSP